MKITGKTSARVVSLVLCLLVAGSVFAGNPKPKGKLQSYLVVSSHTKEECLAALDKASAMGAKNLSQWKWGCMAGDHTGYADVRATSTEEALANVPEPLRAKAKAVPVQVFTQAQIKAFHDM
ncbi:MAG: hypothetical protein HY962_14875 [Ignavibacteriae bacterium]|nr:hypothetical protein [Ignavibacteriota bacterium]